MKKYLLCFICGLFLAQNCAVAAITVKKASSVAKKETKVQDLGSSLLPTAINLYTTVKQLNQQQQELSAECEPTSQEKNWVNDMVKEWAKAGGYISDKKNIAGMAPCSESNTTYSASVQGSVEDDDKICYESFNEGVDKNTVWYGYPKVSSVTYCIIDGEYSTSCTKAKDRKFVSNIYDIFNLIDFQTEDYSESEAAMASKLMAKMEKCAPAKLKAQKAALWGDFVMSTVGGLGQKTGSASIMETVGGLVSSGGGFGGALQSLSGVATQLLDK